MNEKHQREVNILALLLSRLHLQAYLSSLKSELTSSTAQTLDVVSTMVALTDVVATNPEEGTIEATAATAPAMGSNAGC